MEGAVGPLRGVGMAKPALAINYGGVLPSAAAAGTSAPFSIGSRTTPL